MIKLLHEDSLKRSKSWFEMQREMRLTDTDITRSV